MSGTSRNCKRISSSGNIFPSSQGVSVTDIVDPI